MKRLLDCLLAVAIGGIVVQSWIAAGRVPADAYGSAAPNPLDVGDTLLLVTGYSGLGAPDTVFLDGEVGSVTVLYSFHPDCPHSGAVGPEWARHFDEVRATDVGVRRIAVTVDSVSSALDFTDRFGWGAEVVSVAGLSPMRQEYALVSRTPWVFVFDSHGVLRLHGHGSQLDQVEVAVARLLLDQVRSRMTPRRFPPFLNAATRVLCSLLIAISRNRGHAITTHPTTLWR